MTFLCTLNAWAGVKATPYLPFERNQLNGTKRACYM